MASFRLITAFIGWKGVLFLGLLLTIAALSQWIAKTDSDVLGVGGRYRYVFSFVIGTIIAEIILTFTDALALSSIQGNAFFVALGILTIVGLWKFLFGPWGSEIKAAVLGSFVFWIAVDRLQASSATGRVALLIAAAIAFIPAVIWCLLFLQHHRERRSIVVLTFLAGMLSTAPILFYDHVVRKGLELHFFLFRVTPENFMRSSETFVAQSLTGDVGIVSTSAAVTIISFLLVGVIEEWSKNWVLRRSDRAFFRSIDDVMQLSIIAAIGFAFAENIVNPNYFISFVKDYLVLPPKPQWGVFLASVFGRSVITNMVHITSSGVLGYYYGRAFFAEPLLEDERARGQRHHLLSLFHQVLQVRRVTLFQDEMMLQGLLALIGLHSLFDILVSIPDILPGRPQTVGALFHYAGPLSELSIVLLPAIVYVFGGWFLLLMLFRKKAALKEFGRRVRQDLLIRETLTA